MVSGDFYDPSYNGSFLATDLEKQIGSTYRKMVFQNWFVPAPMARFHHIFGFFYPNLWNERMKDIIEGAISGGIINKMFEKYTKSRWNLESIEIDSDQLTMDFDDLILGFQICLFAYYAALVIFLAELIVSYIIKICSDGWDSISNVSNKNKFSHNMTSCSDSIYSSSIDVSSIVSSPRHRLNIALYAESTDSDSEQSMDIRSITYSIAFGDSVDDKMAGKSVKAESDNGTGSDKEDNSAGIVIKIEDFDYV